MIASFVFTRPADASSFRGIWLWTSVNSSSPFKDPAEFRRNTNGRGLAMNASHVPGMAQISASSGGAQSPNISIEAWLSTQPERPSARTGMKAARGVFMAVS